MGRQNFAVMFLLGILIGGFGMYSYYNFGGSKKISQKDIRKDGNTLAASAAYLKFKEIKSSFVPTGTPEVYGKELDISFDKAQDAINKVRIFDPTYGSEGKKIILSGDDLKRYIKIGSQIACEYCCGAKTLVKENGEAACGCEHSQMMRGLAAYLIKNHPDISDERILEELTKWKRTYFPKQMLSAKLQEMKKAGDKEVEDVLKEFPDFLPEMVGGC